MKTATEQYCLYLRKSREDDEAEKLYTSETPGEDISTKTLARHKRTLLDLAKRMNLTVTKIYSEVVSGETISARPVVQELLNDIEQKTWAGVLVMEVERLARGDSIDQGIIARTFKYSDTKIITPAKVYDPNNEFDEEYFEFGLFMSRREYKVINRRLQRGRLAAAKEGRYLGSIAPYGYEKVRINNGKSCTLSPIPEQAEVVKYIFDLYINGDKDDGPNRRPLGCAMIATKLNSMNIESSKGDKWVSVSIRDMISNPVYAGKIRWNWRPEKKKVENGKVVITRPKNKPEDCLLYNGLHPAIISEETYYKAANKEKASPIKKTMGLKNPFASLLVCGLCGRTMVRKPNTNIGFKSYDVSIICATPFCPNIGSDIKAVEYKLIEALENWLGELKAKVQGHEVKGADINIKQTAIQALDKESVKLEEQRKKTYELLEQGVYTTEVFIERQEAIAKKLKENAEEKNKIIFEIDQSQRISDTKIQLIPKIENLLRIYDTLETASEKNMYLKEVVKKAVYVKTVKGERLNYDPFNFQLDLYPNLPEH